MQKFDKKAQNESNYENDFRNSGQLIKYIDI